MWTNWPKNNEKCDESSFPTLNKCQNMWDSLVT